MQGEVTRSLDILPARSLKVGESAGPDDCPVDSTAEEAVASCKVKFATGDAAAGMEMEVVLEAATGAAVDSDTPESTTVS